MMRNTSAIPRLIALALLAVTGPAWDTLAWSQAAGAAPSFGEVLSGKTLPLTLQMKDLTTEWRRVSIGGQVDNTSMMQMMMGGGVSPAFYSTGQTVTIGGETYLVAYRSAAKGMGFAEIMQAQQGRGPLPDKITPESILHLALVNVRSISSFTDIRPFNLAEEIAANELQVAAAQKTMVAVAQAQGGATDAAGTSNLKQLMLGVHQYAQDHDEILPPLDNPSAMKQALLPYVKNESLFVSATGEPYEPNAVLSLRKLAEITNPADIAAIFEANPAPDGKRAVAYLDGHVRRVTEEEWKLIKKMSQVPTRQKPKPEQ